MAGTAMYALWGVLGDFLIILLTPSSALELVSFTLHTSPDFDHQPAWLILKESHHQGEEHCHLQNFPEYSPSFAWPLWGVDFDGWNGFYVFWWEGFRPVRDIVAACCMYHTMGGKGAGVESIRRRSPLVSTGVIFPYLVPKERRANAQRFPLAASSLFSFWP